MANLVANQHEFEKITNKISTLWEITKLVRELEKINPNFYPKAIEVQNRDNILKIVEVQREQLSLKDLIEAHGLCANMLHESNPFSRPKHLSTFINYFNTWYNKIRNLLDLHAITLVNGGVLRIMMHNIERGGRVRVEVLGQMPQGAIIGKIKDKFTVNYNGQILEVKEIDHGTFTDFQIKFPDISYISIFKESGEWQSFLYREDVIELGTLIDKHLTKENISPRNSDFLEKEIRQALHRNKFSSIEQLEKKVTAAGNQIHHKKLLSAFYTSYGRYLNKTPQTITQKSNKVQILLNIAEKYQKATTYDLDNARAHYYLATVYSELLDICDASEFEVYFEKSVYEFEKAASLDETNASLYYNWGITLETIAKLKEPIDAIKFLQDACEKYEKATQIKPDKALAYCNWGNTLHNLASLQKVKRKRSDFLSEAIEKYNVAISIESNYLPFYNKALVYSSLYRIQKKYSLYLLAIENFQKSWQINSNNALTCLYWGNIISLHASYRKGTKAIQLYKESIRKFQEALEIDHNNYMALINWADALCNIANTSKKDSNNYQQAIAKLRMAENIDPNQYDLYNVWGKVYISMAINIGTDKNDSINKAILQFQAAAGINPNCESAYFNCAYCLLILSKLKKSSKHHLEQKANNLFRKAFDLGTPISDITKAYFSQKLILTGSFMSLKFLLSKINHH